MSWSDLSKAVFSGSTATCDVSSGAVTYTTTTSDGWNLTITDRTDGTYHVTNTDNGNTYTNIDTSTLGNMMTGGYFPAKMTVEERKKLDQLRQDKSRWIHEQKLKKFKLLPPHIRQAIVDESYVKDFIDEMNNTSFHFPEQNQINELETREFAYQKFSGSYQNYVSFTSATNFAFNEMPYPDFRYTSILNEFNTEELANAHTEATIEENLDG